VRASILALLKDRPMHVYPTLQLLEDEGLIGSTSDGGKKLFELTEAGRAEVEAGPEAPWEEAGRGADWEAMNEVKKAGVGLVDAFRQVWAAGTPEQREKALAVMNKARKELYLILAEED
jgi:DNA-binding PadR family transcriptional regulator